MANDRKVSKEAIDLLVLLGFFILVPYLVVSFTPKDCSIRQCKNDKYGLVEFSRLTCGRMEHKVGCFDTIDEAISAARKLGCNVPGEKK